MIHIIYFLLRLLKREESFTFIPRSREELPDNFPKEISGVCYFLEVRTGPKQPKPSLSSSRIKKVSYNIGTMFLRETSLWDLLQIKDSSKKHKPRTWIMTGEWKDCLSFTALWRKSSGISVMSGNNPRKRRVMTVNKKLEGKGEIRCIHSYECFWSYIYYV